MSKKPAFRGALMRIVPISLAAGLVFAAAQAHAGYGGHYYGGYRSGHYGSYGSHYGGYRGSRYGGYRGNYYGGIYRGYRGGNYYGGYPYYGYSRGSAYSGGSPPLRAATRAGSTYNVDPEPAPQPNSGEALESGINEGGWAQLAAGEYSEALSAFAAETVRYPRVGKPKVGYALSAAATGDLRRGIWAMRRALRIDPDSMHYLTIDDSLRLRIEQLITRYQTYPDRTSDNTDSAFMLASLHYLLGDARTARSQVNLGVAAGDRSSSTANLERLIDNELTAVPERGTEN